MERRTFLTSVLGSAVVMSAAAKAAEQGSSTQPSPEFYVWRQYVLRNGTQLRRLADFLQNAAIPALNRLGHKPVGAFEVVAGVPAPTVFLLTPCSTLESLAGLDAALEADAEYARAGAAYIDAPATDAPYLASYLHSIAGPIVLVAHSYGGFVATNAATGNTNVKALVYIDSFMPDEREIAGALVASWGSCVDPSGLKVVPSGGDVDLYLRWEANSPYPGFIDCFANGVGLEDARVLAATQRPAAAAQFSVPSGPPAWKSIPSWSLIGTLDNVIPRPLQEMMSSRAGAEISRVKAGHLTPITRPAQVTKVILSAVDATS